VFDASRLARVLGQHADRAELTSNIVVFSLVAVFGLLILAGYVFMYRRTLAGISALKAGAEIVGTGDLDHRIPEDRRDELGDLSRAFNKMTTDLKSVGGMYLSQLHIASTLQQSLLDVPEQTHGIDFGHLYRSATLEASVGGDFYDVFEVDDRRVALLIGDVSGHGVEAARIAILVKDIVYAFSRRSSVPSDVVASTNELLLGKRIRGFVTLFFAVLDPSTGLLTYCSAGHPNALVVDSGGHVRLLEAASPPVGIFPGTTWKDGEVLLTENDLLFLYTDGLIEARRSGEFFGQDGLVNAIVAAIDLTSEELPKQVLDTALAFTDGVLADDVALLALRLTGTRR
jgi:serine phosphatase RsbU (regulator of sigma subunit)